MGSGELQTWNGHFDRGVYIDYTLEPLQSERHIEGTKDEPRSPEAELMKIQRSK